MDNLFSRSVTVFHDRPLPKDAAMVAGYAWLIQDYARLPIGSVDSFFATKQRKALKTQTKQRILNLDR